MSANNTKDINISAIFVGYSTGKYLKTFITPDIVLVVNDVLPFNINTQLIIPFSILIGICFLIMVYFLYKIFTLYISYYTFIYIIGKQL